VTVPIYQTSTYMQEAVGEHRGYDYSRVANPTRTALQICLASLEGAEHGLAFSSGLGATMTLVHLLEPGDRVVAVADVYGGVYRMFSQVYQPNGYVFDWGLGGRHQRRARRAPRRTHADRLARDADQPAAEHRRHPRRSRDRT
jgi:cystathionine beta-lyase/cystathionine gamma-synthase